MKQVKEELEIENKVAKSGLITFNLEELYPQGERVLLDMKDFLFEGLILREKDFRQAVKETDWSQYQDKFVAITCSADAIVPTWAYMLLTSELQPHAKKVVFGTLETLETVLFTEAIDNLDLKGFRDERIIVKGCSKFPVPDSAYVELINKLRPVAKTLMFGEACSTVPIYKKPRA